jgi:hypothetical protein
MTAQRWVLLAYRMPREPSTPRIAVWRNLEQLGVARLGDGLVGVPADARTREQLDWLAQEVRQAGGTASVGTSIPTPSSPSSPTGSRYRPGATGYDMPGVELSHHGDDCTFETMLRRYELTDPVLWRLAEIVHEADLEDERFDAPRVPAPGGYCSGEPA